MCSDLVFRTCTPLPVEFVVAWKLGHAALFVALVGFVAADGVWAGANQRGARGNSSGTMILHTWCACCENVHQQLGWRHLKGQGSPSDMQGLEDRKEWGCKKGISDSDYYKGREHAYI